MAPWHPVVATTTIQSPPSDQRTNPEMDTSEYTKKKSRVILQPTRVGFEPISGTAAGREMQGRSYTPTEAEGKGKGRKH